MRVRGGRRLKDRGGDTMIVRGKEVEEKEGERIR